MNKPLTSKWRTLFVEFLIFSFTATVLTILNYWSHPRDAGAYISGGMKIISGLDPYADEVFRGAPFGATILALALGNLSPEIQSVIILLLSVLGTWAFSRIVFSNGIAGIFACFIVQVSSSNRTSMDTIQLTGIILGAVAILIHLGMKPKLLVKLPIFLGAGLTFSVLNDSKPHIVLPFLILLGIKLHMKKFLYSVIAIQIVGHLTVGFFFGFYHLFNWLKLILRIGEAQEYEKFEGAAHNYWQLVTYLLPNLPSWVALTPFVLYFAIICLGILRVKNLTLVGTLSVASFAISITSYSHFYDLVPVVALMILSLKEIGNKIIATFVILFILAPQNWNSFFNFSIIMVVVCSFLVIELASDGNFKWQKNCFGLIYNMSQIVYGLIAYFLLQTINDFILTERKLIDALTTTELIIIFSYLIFRARNIMFYEKDY